MKRLTLGSLVRSALATYREDFWRVAGLALVVFVPLAVLETLAERGAQAYEESRDEPLAIAVLAVTLVGVSASIFGLTLFSGALDRMVGARHFGHEDMPLGEVIRTLPYGRLILANFVVAVTVEVGLLLAVVPGVLAMTLLSIVGPLVNIEGHSVREALWHSVRLVRPRFWLAFFGITVPVLIEQAAEHRVATAFWDDGFLAGFAVNAGFALVVGATVGLLEVTLAHALIARDRLDRHPELRPARVGGLPRSSSA